MRVRELSCLVLFLASLVLGGCAQKIQIELKPSAKTQESYRDDAREYIKMLVDTHSDPEIRRVWNDLLWSGKVTVRYILPDYYYTAEGRVYYSLMLEVFRLSRSDDPTKPRFILAVNTFYFVDVLPKLPGDDGKIFGHAGLVHEWEHINDDLTGKVELPFERDGNKHDTYPGCVAVRNRIQAELNAYLAEFRYTAKIKTTHPDLFGYHKYIAKHGERRGLLLYLKDIFLNMRSPVRGAQIVIHPEDERCLKKVFEEELN